MPFLIDPGLRPSGRVFISPVGLKLGVLSRVGWITSTPHSHSRAALTKPSPSPHCLCYGPAHVWLFFLIHKMIFYIFLEAASKQIFFFLRFFPLKCSFKGSAAAATAWHLTCDFDQNIVTFSSFLKINKFAQLLRCGRHKCQEMGVCISSR